MNFIYKNNDFMICELKEINKNTSFDIIAIFKINTFIMNGFQKIKKISLDEARKNEKEIYKNNNDIISEYEFINYFYEVDEENETLINTSKKYIDMFYKMEFKKNDGIRSDKKAIKNN